jgi:hypothetical protein
MHTKEEFMNQASELWDKLIESEKKCSDLYEFEEQFEGAMNQFGHQAMEDVLGSKKKDRREKKNSKHDMM